MEVRDVLDQEDIDKVRLDSIIQIGYLVFYDNVFQRYRDIGDLVRLG